MTFDELQKNWQAQKSDPKLAIDPDLLLREIKRNKISFECSIFWRDFREVGIAIIMFVYFLFIGIKNSLWPMLLLALICLWVGVFMVADRIVQKRRQPCLSDSLFNCVKNSLGQINHQIWLLRNVLWWYLAPLGVGILICFGHFGLILMQIEKPPIGLMLFFLACVVGTILLCWGIYWLNQRAIRIELAPRKHELEDILNSFKIDKS